MEEGQAAAVPATDELGQCGGQLRPKSWRVLVAVPHHILQELFFLAAYAKLTSKRKMASAAMQYLICSGPLGRLVDIAKIVVLDTEDTARSASEEVMLAVTKVTENENKKQAEERNCG